MSSKALNRDEKQLKYNAILNSAAVLFGEQQKLPTVAAIAAHCDQAKGTVYLYFSSKEAIFLALLQQHYQQWFARITTALDEHPTPLNIISSCCDYIHQHPEFFELASLDSCMLEPGVKENIKIEYQQWFTEQITRTANHLHQQLQVISEKQSLGLLLDSHALLLGLWQQSKNTPELTVFERQSKTALARLWKGYFAS